MTRCYVLAKALARDGYKCQVCSITQDDSKEKFRRDLYVVHIDNIKNHKLDNLITFCKKCHNKRIMKIMMEKLKSIKKDF